MPTIISSLEYPKAFLLSQYSSSSIFHCSNLVRLFKIRLFTQHTMVSFCSLSCPLCCCCAAFVVCARCCNLVSFVHENEFVLLFALICLINYIYAIASQTIMFFSVCFCSAASSEKRRERDGEREQE